MNSTHDRLLSITNNLFAINSRVQDWIEQHAESEALEMLKEMNLY